MSALKEIRKYFSSAIIIAELELRKIRHDQTQVWVRMIQPALWLAIYGLTMSKLSGMSAFIPKNLTYLQFMTPGVLAQSALFVAIFFGINVVWERDLGLLNKLLSTPASRSSIILGKALSAGVRGIFQAVAVIILALILQVHLIMNPLAILGSFCHNYSCKHVFLLHEYSNCIFSQDQGTHDGHRSSNDHAVVLRQQRYLPYLNYAVMD